MRWPAPILALLLLAGCGNAPSGNTALLRNLAGIVTGDGGESPGVPENAPLSAALGLGQAQLAALDRPLLFVGMRPEGLVAGLTARTRTGATTNWITQDGIAVTETGGVVTATRGLPGDLMSADVSEVLAALEAGGGKARRIHYYLTPTEQTAPRAWACTLVSEGEERVPLPGGARQLQRIRENCRGTDGQFVNRYWLDAGKVWQSVQHVGPGQRVMRLQRYRR